MPTFGAEANAIRRSNEGKVPTQEEFIKTMKMLGEKIYELLPLTWIPEMIEDIRNAKTKEEYALYVGMSLVFLGLDAADLFPIARAGTKVVKTTLDEAIKKATRNLVERGIEKETAEKIATQYVKAITENKIVGREIKETSEIAEMIAKKYNDTNEIVNSAKGFFVHKEESLLYNALENKIENAQKNLMEILFNNPRDAYLFKKGIKKIGIGQIDKGWTWYLNDLSKELGDVGLTIYMKAVASNADKYGVKLIMTGGDEIVVISTGGAKNIEKFFEAVISDMKKDVQLMKESLKSEKLLEAFEIFEEALSKVSFHVDDVTLKVINGKVMMASSHAPGEFYTLSTMLSKFETEGLSKKLSQEHFKILSNFTKLSGEPLKKLNKVDGVFTARLGFSKRVSEAMKAAGEAEGKAVSQALEKDAVGPSLLNQFGHSCPDYFSRKYAGALEKAFEEAGYAVEVGQAGSPLSISYAFKGEGKTLAKEELESISKRANEIFLDEVRREHPELEIEGVRSVFGFNKDAAEKVLRKEITHGVLEWLNDVQEQELKRAIALFHTKYKGLFIEELHEKLVKRFGTEFVSRVPDVVSSALENVPKWVRQPEDLVTYLKTKGLSDQEVKTTIGLLVGVSI